MKQNEILRFTNLPLNTEYTIEEVYANLRQADPSRDEDAHPSVYTDIANKMHCSKPSVNKALHNLKDNRTCNLPNLWYYRAYIRW